MKQRIIIVSTSPIPYGENITIPLSEKLPLPIRIGISFNRVLKTLREKEGGLNYDYIFKVDGDVKLPKDYLSNLLSKNVPLAGIGYAFLIKKEFFDKVLREYPVNMCDDGYVFARSAAAIGAMPPPYNGASTPLSFPSACNFHRFFHYGIEHYKWGDSLIVLLLSSLVFMVKKPSSFRVLLKPSIFCIVGYIFAWLTKRKKYCWWQQYNAVRVGTYSRRITRLQRKLRPQT
ncbi:MAG: hypothetical protein QXZ17_09425 [Nitrososphaerota archaeon]